MTKPKLPTKRKKQAVTVTRSAATKAIIRRNATTSPLLRLPGEIREMIFSFVVGYRFIHLLYLPIHRRFYHAVCTAAASEDEIYEQFTTGHTRIRSVDSTKQSTAFRERHSHCTRGKTEILLSSLSWAAKSIPPEKRHRPMLNLSILGTCRQIYEESNVLLWTTNTFSFQDGLTLKFFVDSLHLTQRKKLTRMLVDYTWWSPYVPVAEDWKSPFDIAFVSRLSGLRTLHVTISPSWKIYVAPDRDIPKCFLMLQALPLQHVTVVIGDSTDWASFSLKRPWDTGIAARRHVAEALRRKLLDPKGPENLAAEMRAEKAERMQEKKEKLAKIAARRARRI